MTAVYRSGRRVRPLQRCPSVRRYHPASHACSRGQPGRFSANAPTSLARGDRAARACRPFRTDAHRVATPETENDMELSTPIAQWSGKLPPGFARAVRSAAMHHCSCSRSNSSHRAPRTSPLRVAVSTRNSRHNFELSDAPQARMSRSAAETAAYGSDRWCFRTLDMTGSAPLIASPATFCSTW